MKIARAFTIFASAVAVAFGCKKNTTETTSLYMNGSMKFDVPEFVEAGDHFEIEPYGLFKATDKYSSTVGIYVIKPITGEKDTLRVDGDSTAVKFAYDVPDTIGKFTITAVGFASGYYNSSLSKSFTIIDPARDSGSITGLDGLDTLFAGYDDSRPDFICPMYVTTIGGNDWLATNEYFLGRPYASSPVMGPIFGNYLTADEARNGQVCPEGWHLSTEDEWVDLATALGCGDAEKGYPFKGIAGSLMVDARLFNERLWQYYPDVKITNSAKFYAMPCGYATVAGESYSFTTLGDYASFWSRLDADKLVVRYLHKYSNDVMCLPGVDDGGFAASVRCVRDRDD